MTVLSDLIDSLIHSDRPIADTLRSAKVLASRLGSAELATWVDRELSGYPTRDSLPPYRKLQVLTLGDFSGPFGSSVRNSPVPYLVFPEQWREQAQYYFEMHGVAAIEEMLSGDKDVELQWDPNLTLILRDKVQMTGGMVLTRLHSSLPRQELIGVLDEVRNRLLALVLDVEKENPDAGASGQRAEQPSPERVQQIFNNHIYSAGNVAIGSTDFEQTASIVIHGDFETLRTALKSVGANDDEINELKSVLDEEKNFGSRVAEWIGRMVGKAYSGALAVSGSAAGQVLGMWIAAYLGIGLPAG